jgi:hypothetical protein
MELGVPETDNRVCWLEKRLKRRGDPIQESRVAIFDESCSAITRENFKKERESQAKTVVVDELMRVVLPLLEKTSKKRERE